ncbi:unnamed protein product, partial [Adineta ricciae]
MENIYTCEILGTNLTTKDNSTVNDLCSIDYLNINSYDESFILLKDSSCPIEINIYSYNQSFVENVCAIFLANLIAENQSKIQMNSSFVCPQKTIINGKDQGEILEICASQIMNIIATQSSIITMNSTHNCPNETQIISTDQT